MKTIIKFIVGVVMFIGIVNYNNKGLKLWNAPKQENIEKVTVVYQGEEKTYDNQDLFMYFQCPRIKLFSLKKNNESTDTIQITYDLKDGSTFEFTMNNQTLWHNGKTYSTKDALAYILAKDNFNHEH